MEIDKEVRRLVTEAHAKATQLVSENRAALERIAENLLEREVLDGHQVDILMKGGELAPMAPEEPLSGKDEEDRTDPAEGKEERPRGDSAPVGGPLKQPS